MSQNGGWVLQIENKTNAPEDLLSRTEMTPEGDVASSTHIRGSWVGLSEGNDSCSSMKIEKIIK